MTTYGNTLGSVTLPNGWAWNDPADTPVGNMGERTFNATFTPMDAENYNTVICNLTITVAGTNPAVTIPTGLTAAKATVTSIRINWTASSGADGYEVWYATSKSGTYTKAASVKVNTYTHTGLTIGMTYYYKVCAYKVVDKKTYYSGFTSVESITLPVPKPTGVRTASAGATSIKVSWKEVSGATGYMIYRSAKQIGGYKQIAKVSAGRNYYMSKDLKKGKTYYYKVRAYKKVINAERCSYDSNVVKKKAALTKPRVTLKAGKNSIKISWQKVAGATMYEVYRSTNKNEKYRKVATIKATKQTYANMRLTKGKKYYFKVKAVQKIDKKTYKSVFSTWKSAEAK